MWWSQSRSSTFRTIITVVILLGKTSVSSPNHPNILFLMTDQQRFDGIRRAQDMIQEYGDKLKVRTPNLDKLSREGAYFLHAYTQSPICGPARTAMRTGSTIERTGVQTNSMVERSEAPSHSIPVFLQKVNNIDGIDQILVEEYGYVSEYYGKWHMPVRLYYRRDNDTELAIRYNDYVYETGESRFRRSAWGIKLRKFLKYADSLNLINTSHYTDGQQQDSYSHQPYTPITLDSRYGMPTGTSLDSFDAWSKSQNSVMGRYTLDENFTSSFYNFDIAMKALERLAAAEEEKPWLLTVSYHHPHPSMMAIDKYLDYYWENRQDIFVSPNHLDPMNNSAYFETNELRRLELKGYLEPRNIKEWTALYYAMIEEADTLIGRMLDRLKELGLEDNTMVIFTSDHGEMLGAHRGMRGKARLFEESVKIPLMIKFPGHIEPNTVVHERVSQLDVVSTILDYVGADLEESDNSDGKSLRRFIESSYTNQHYDETVVVTEWDYREPSESGLQKKLGSRPGFALYHGGWKLLIHKKRDSPGNDMLFWLEQDPYELWNYIGRLGNDPSVATDAILGRAEMMKVMLLEWMLRNDGGPEHQYYSHPYHNANEGQGDIMEISERQQWRPLHLWISHLDSPLEFGQPVWNRTHYVHNGYLYFGRRTDGSVEIQSVQVVGVHASLVSIDLSLISFRWVGNETANTTAWGRLPGLHVNVSETSLSPGNFVIHNKEHVRMRVQYTSSTQIDPEGFHAAITVRVNGDDKTYAIPLRFSRSSAPAAFTSAPTEPPILSSRPSSGPSLKPSYAPTGGPSSRPTDEPTGGLGNETTIEPTEQITNGPTREPTYGITNAPTTPAKSQTNQPSNDATETPTIVLSSKPTNLPSDSSPQLIPTQTQPNLEDPTISPAPIVWLTWPTASSGRSLTQPLVFPPVAVVATLLWGLDLLR